MRVDPSVTVNRKKGKYLLLGAAGLCRNVSGDISLLLGPMHVCVPAKPATFLQKHCHGQHTLLLQKGYPDCTFMQQSQDVHPAAAPMLPAYHSAMWTGSVRNTLPLPYRALNKAALVQLCIHATVLG